MTTLTTPARTAHSTNLRPVPWRRMSWVTWRQHRAVLGGVAVFLGGFAVYLWLSGLQMHHAYTTDCSAASSLTCGDFTGTYGTSYTTVYVSLKMVSVADGRILAGADYVVPRSAEVEGLIRRRVAGY